jgi:hypothetical protein
VTELQRHVAAVNVHPDAPRLRGGIELVDSAGTGSVHQHDTTEAHQALDQMDLAVFVVSAGGPRDSQTGPMPRRQPGAAGRTKGDATG